MKILRSGNVLVLYNTTLPDNLLRLLEAMNTFNLDSCSPIEPTLHGPDGYYECNRVVITEPAKVVRNVMLIKADKAPENMAFPNVKSFSDIVPSLRHGLVCNVVHNG